MAFRTILLLLLFTSSMGFAQESSRDNTSSSESWRIPLVKGGYPLKKFPKAKISREKPAIRDIGGKKNLTLAEFNKIMDRKIDEFHNRIKAEIKEDQKMTRLMKAPKYSDPSYFGHKRKPKKRSTKRRKFCKECGIVH